MNRILFLSTVKKNAGFLLCFAVSVAGLILCFVILFPSMTAGSGYAQMLQALPPGMTDALGMTGDLTRMNDYLNMNFYNSVCLYLLMAYVILFATTLVAKPIEDTSLSFCLSAPVTRKGFFYTVSLVLAAGLFAILLCSFLSGIASWAVFAGGSPFDIGEFIKDNLLIGCLFFFLGSICLLTAACSNKSSDAMAIGSTFVLVEYVLDLLVKLSDGARLLRYFTVFTLYDPDRIRDDFVFFGTGCAALCAAAVLITVLTAQLFKKRDLAI